MVKTADRAATARDIPPKILKDLDLLRSTSEKTRISSCNSLVHSLFHDSKAAKQRQGDGDAEDNDAAVVYVLKRLVMGLASSSIQARQGFGLALSLLLSQEPNLRQTAVEMAHSAHTVNGGVPASRELREAALANIFFWAAYARSLRLEFGEKGDPANGSVSIPVQRMTKTLMACTSQSSWGLADAAVQVIKGFVDLGGYNGKDVQEDLKDWVHRRTCMLDGVDLALVISNKFKASYLEKVYSNKDGLHHLRDALLSPFSSGFLVMSNQSDPLPRVIAELVWYCVKNTNTKVLPAISQLVEGLLDSPSLDKKAVAVRVIPDLLFGSWCIQARLTAEKGSGLEETVQSLVSKLASKLPSFKHRPKKSGSLDQADKRLQLALTGFVPRMTIVFNKMVENEEEHGRNTELSYVSHNLVHLSMSSQGMYEMCGLPALRVACKHLSNDDALVIVQAILSKTQDKLESIGIHHLYLLEYLASQQDSVEVRKASIHLLGSICFLQGLSQQLQQVAAKALAQLSCSHVEWVANILETLRTHMKEAQVEDQVMLELLDGAIFALSSKSKKKGSINAEPRSLMAVVLGQCAIASLSDHMASRQFVLDRMNAFLTLEQADESHALESMLELLSLENAPIRTAVVNGFRLLVSEASSSKGLVMLLCDSLDKQAEQMIEEDEEDDSGEGEKDQDDDEVSEQSSDDSDAKSEESAEEPVKEVVVEISKESDEEESSELEPDMNVDDVDEEELARFDQNLSTMMSAMGTAAGKSAEKRRQLEQQRVNSMKFRILDLLEGITKTWNRHQRSDSEEQDSEESAECKVLLISRVCKWILDDDALTDELLQRSQKLLVGQVLRKTSSRKLAKLIQDVSVVGDALSCLVQGLETSLRRQGKKNLEVLGSLLRTCVHFVISLVETMSESDDHKELYAVMVAQLAQMVEQFGKRRDSSFVNLSFLKSLLQQHLAEPSAYPKLGWALAPSIADLARNARSSFLGDVGLELLIELSRIQERTVKRAQDTSFDLAQEWRLISELISSLCVSSNLSPKRLRLTLNLAQHALVSGASASWDMTAMTEMFERLSEQETVQSVVGVPKILADLVSRCEELSRNKKQKDASEIVAKKRKAPSPGSEPKTSSKKR